MVFILFFGENGMLIKLGKYLHFKEKQKKTPLIRGLLNLSGE
jgi:hypothetical protein